MHISHISERQKSQKPRRASPFPFFFFHLLYCLQAVSWIADPFFTLPWIWKVGSLEITFPRMQSQDISQSLNAASAQDKRQERQEGSRSVLFLQQLMWDFPGALEFPLHKSPDSGSSFQTFLICGATIPWRLAANLRANNRFPSLLLL